MPAYPIYHFSLFSRHYFRVAFFSPKYVRVEQQQERNFSFGQCTARRPRSTGTPAIGNVSCGKGRVTGSCGVHHRRSRSMTMAATSTWHSSAARELPPCSLHTALCSLWFASHGHHKPVSKYLMNRQVVPLPRHGSEHHPHPIWAPQACFNYWIDRLQRRRRRHGFDHHPRPHGHHSRISISQMNALYEPVLQRSFEFSAKGGRGHRNHVKNMAVYARSTSAEDSRALSLQHLLPDESRTNGIIIGFRESCQRTIVGGSSGTLAYEKSL